jgi:hypothetical protein
VKQNYVDLDLSSRKSIIKNIAEKIHSKLMNSTLGFKKIGFSVQKVEEFTKSELKNKIKITSDDIDHIDKKLGMVFTKVGDGVLLSQRGSI